MDALPVHLTSRVLNVLGKSGLWPLLVPSRTTDALQPLDTHGFSCYKHSLREACDVARTASAAGDISILQFIGCLRSAIAAHIVEREWHHAFAENGYSYQQAGISRRLLMKMDTNQWTANCDAPSVEQVGSCCPLRKFGVGPAARIWRVFISGVARGSSDPVVRVRRKRTSPRRAAEVNYEPYVCVFARSLSVRIWAAPAPKQCGYAWEALALQN